MFFLYLFCITKKILISIRLYCVIIKTLAIIGLAVMFCIKQLVIVNFSFHKSVCTLKIPNIKRKWRKSLSIIGLEPTTSLIRGQYLNHCATDVNTYVFMFPLGYMAFWILNKINCSTVIYYILAYASVTIYNSVYLFNINSRKLDGYRHRSWIEYLNESIKYT